MIDEALLLTVNNLSAADRLELIVLVWESFDLGDLPVTDLEQATLDSRIEDESQNPHDTSPWHEVGARLSRRLR